MRGQTGLARSNTGSDNCVKYTPPHQGPEGAGSWSHMAHQLGRAMLTSASQTHSQRHCLGHTSFSMHGDRRVYSVPRFQSGIDPFIGLPSRNGKMPVYRAPCIYSPIHRDTTTSMARGPSAKPPHPSFFSIAKRRTSSRYQSKGRRYNYLNSNRYYNYNNNNFLFTNK